MSLRFRCAECGATVNLPGHRLDKKNYCPRCDARLPNRPVGSGTGVGLILALVIGICVLGVLGIVGISVLIWYLAADAAPKPVVVAQGPAEVKDEARPMPPAEKRQEPEPWAPPGVPMLPPIEDNPRPPFPELPPDAGIPEIKRPEPKGPPPVKDLNLPPLPAPVDIRPAPVAEATDYKLPDTAERAVIGGAGRFLVLHIPKSRKLGIFDTNIGKIEKYIDLPEDKIHFTAGMSKLLVFLPSAELIRRYDLETAKLEVTRPLKVRNVTGFAMGHSSAGPLVVRGSDGARLYDINTFAVIPLPEEREEARFAPGGVGGKPERMLPFDGGEIWPGGNGRVFGNTGNWGMPNGVKVLNLEGGNIKFIGEHTSTSFVQPSPDGKYIFAAGHKPVTVDLKPTTDTVETGLNQSGGTYENLFLPATHGPYYLQIGGTRPRGGIPQDATKEGKVRVFLYGFNQPVATLDISVAGRDDWAGRVQFPTAIVLVPRANLLIVRSPDKLRLIPVDLEKELDKSGADFLIVSSAPPAHYKPGFDFAYAVKAKSKAGGIQYKVASGPDGMKVDANGIVSWRVPVAQAGQVSVILSLKDKGGKEAFHTFNLTPEGEAAVVQGPDPGPGVAEPVKPAPAKAGIRLPPTPARLPIKALPLTERKEYSLPDLAERAIPAGGGRLLVLHFPKQRKVGVFDMNEHKIVRYINLAEDKPLLTAGMTKLVVYLPSAKLIQRFDLLTGEREANKVLDVPNVKAIAMGSASAGPLVISAQEGGRLFDLDTLTEMELPKDEPAPDRFGREPPPGPKRLPFHGDKIWAAANGRMFVGHGGFDGAAITIEGNQIKTIRAHGDSWMFAQPSADGK
jgi:hypothetical protein